MKKTVARVFCASQEGRVADDAGKTARWQQVKKKINLRGAGG
jgi:hypothetical protein